MEELQRLTTEEKGIERRGKQATNVQRPHTSAQVRNSREKKHQMVLAFSIACIPEFQLASALLTFAIVKKPKERPTSFTRIS